LKQMEKNWDVIQKYIGNLPRTPENNMIRSSWARRIVELRDIDRKKFKEIADILEQEFKDSESVDIINEDYVKILYRRFKQINSNKKIK